MSIIDKLDQFPKLPKSTHPFAPPNLVQNLSASLLSSLEQHQNDTPGTLILLASAHIPPPPPRFQDGPRVFRTISSSDKWDVKTLRSAHDALGESLGIHWDADKAKKAHVSDATVRSKTRGDVGEGSMYI